MEMDKTSGSELEKALEFAQERLRQALRSKCDGAQEEIQAASAALLHLERNLASDRNQEYAEPLDFPVKWDAKAPIPHLLADGIHCVLAFQLSEGRVAVVEFPGCVSSRFGDPNEDMFELHPLHGKGLQPYSAQVVKNSSWVIQLQAMSRADPGYDAERWQDLKHYVFWFHDNTFECVARGYEVQIFQMSMAEALSETISRYFDIGSTITG